MTVSYIPPQQLPWGVAASPGSQFWDPHSYLEAQSHNGCDNFLYIEMAGVTPSVVIIFRGATSSFFPNTQRSP